MVQLVLDCRTPAYYSWFTTAVCTGKQVLMIGSFRLHRRNPVQGDSLHETFCLTLFYAAGVPADG